MTPWEKFVTLYDWEAHEEGGYDLGPAMSIQDILDEPGLLWDAFSWEGVFTAAKRMGWHIPQDAWGLAADQGWNFNDDTKLVRGFLRILTFDGAKPLGGYL